MFYLGACFSVWGVLPAECAPTATNGGHSLVIYSVFWTLRKIFWNWRTDFGILGLFPELWALFQNSRGCLRSLVCILEFWDIFQNSGGLLECWAGSPSFTSLDLSYLL